MVRTRPDRNLKKMAEETGGGYFELKKTDDLSAYSQEQLDAIATRLNTRPRETLGWRFPVDVLNETIKGVALTG